MMTARASHHLSPLRYPGGKGKLAPTLKKLIRSNKLLDRIYVEPFAGGAGVALALLMHGYVKSVIINDLNPPIYAFWRSILRQNEAFRELIRSVEVTPAEWAKQKLMLHSDSASELELGFAAFFLNRTNHSGVLNGGMIGGKRQDSAFKIDARFNKEELEKRVARIARYASRIEVTNFDAIDMIKGLRSSKTPQEYFVYADPPYVDKGPDLYYSFFNQQDHRDLAAEISLLPHEMAWAVSYDETPLVFELYESFRRANYSLSYSVRNGGNGREVMFFSDCIGNLEAFLECEAT
jgi:DNA adenine methylase